MGLAGSVMLDVFREAGFVVMAEAFADRRYEADGSLRSRKFADALIRDPDEAAERIAPYVELGFTHLVFHAPGPDQARFLEQFSRDVLPRLRARHA